MEPPMFSLSKPDHRLRHYKHNANIVTIKPVTDGLANIWDKDILIDVDSRLFGMSCEIYRTVRVTAYDILVSINRFNAQTKRAQGTPDRRRAG
jgi:plasmid replication initiation protein